MRYRFGGFELDVREGTLRRGEQSVDVQPKVVDALVLFVRRAGELVTREELLAALWPDTHVSDDALQQLVRKVRKALGDDATEAQFVETVPRRGYRFVASVAEIEVREEVAAAEESGTGSVAAAAAGAAAAAAAAAATATGRTTAAATAAPAATTTAAAAASAAATAPVRRRRWWVVAVAIVMIATVAGVAVLALREGGPRFQKGSCTPVRLTHSLEREQDGAFLGRSVVFVANDAEEGQYDLFVTSRAGDGRLRLTHTPGDEFYPQVAPGGSAILFSRGDGDDVGVWEIGPNGGTARLVAAGAYFATYAPGGDELAYLRPGGETSALVVRARAGGDERVVATVAATAGSVAWSADGRTLAFVDGRRVWTVAAAGGEPRPATPLASHLRTVTWAGPALISDGNFTGRGGLWWTLPGRTPQSITTNAGGQYHPAVDGRDVLYTAEKREQLLYLARGAAVRRVATTTTMACFDISADGSRIAFTDYDPTAGGRESEAVLQVVGSEVRDVLGHGSCPRFSPDGSRVAYVRRDGDRDALWMHPGGRFGPAGVEPLEAPAWDAGGTSLVVATRDGLARVTADAVTILAPGRFGRVDVAPDGTVAAARDGAVTLFPRDSAAVTLPIAPSYENAPTWTTAGLAVLARERAHPVLVTYDRSGRELARTPVPAVHDPGLWGVFEVRPFRDGWAFIHSRYESDLYILGDCLR